MVTTSTSDWLNAHFQAAETMQQGVLFLDREGNILSANQSFVAALKYPQSRFEPKTIFQVNPHFNFMAWKKLWTELESKGQVELDTEHLNATGETVPAKLKGILLKNNGQSYCKAILEADPAEEQEILRLARFSLDHANEFILWVNTDGAVIYANKAAKKTLGYTTEELLTIKIFDLEPGLSKKKWTDLWEEVKARKWLQRKTKRRTKANKVFPVEMNLRYMASNRQECVALFDRDINISKQNKRRIILANKALESTIQMIYWLGPDGRFQYANQSCCQKLGYSLKELKRMYLWEVEPGLNEELWQARWARLKAEKTLIIDCIRRSKQGKRIPIMLHLNYLESDGEEYNLAIASDLSGRKEAEEKLRLSFATLDQSPDMICWLRKDGSFRYFNKSFAKMTGYTGREISNMTVLDFSPKFKKDDFKKGWEVLKSGKMLSAEQEITCKDGSTILVAANIGMVRSGNKEYSSTVLRDIRRWKKQEQLLKNQLEAIKQLQQQLQEENIELKAEIESTKKFDNMISQSDNYKPILRQISQVAGTIATVLILGETGTGKELIARAIYNLSERSDRPFVKINCGALPENLIESELFGHEKGAFTGAYKRKIGSFERAHKGTIFLDEIGELPLDLQAKLLQVLQEGKFQRIGGNETINVDVRVIAATNRHLEKLVDRGKFRKDLFYRLNVFPIYNIPLRERKEDIPLLVQHFIKKYNQKLGRRIEEVSSSAMKELKSYEYPGNVRELENLIERAMILSPGKELVGHFQFKKTSAGRTKTFRSMEDMQRHHILDALRRTKGKVTGPGGAAELLKMKDKTLYSRMRKLGIGRHDYR